MNAIAKTEIVTDISFPAERLRLPYHEEFKALGIDNVR